MFHYANKTVIVQLKKMSDYHDHLHFICNVFNLFSINNPLFLFINLLMNLCIFYT